MMSVFVEDHEDSLLGELHSLDMSLDNSKKRNHLYRSLILSEYGSLGVHNHVRIPECIVSHIHSISIDLNSYGRYTGFREYGEDGRHEGALGQNNNKTTNKNDDDNNDDGATEGM
jgi:hypothetical protein